MAGLFITCCNTPKEEVHWSTAMLTPADNIERYSIWTVPLDACLRGESCANIPRSQISIDNISFAVSNEREWVIGGLSYGAARENGEEKDKAHAEYCSVRMANLNRFLDKDTNLGVKHWAPRFFDGGIAGHTRVTADCQLFGIPAGENLIDHCVVVRLGQTLRFLCRYPSFEVIKVVESESLGVLGLKEYLGEDLVLPDVFGEGDLVFAFDSVPEERPDQMTLTLSVPVEYESWSRFDWVELLNPDGILPVKRNIEGSVTAHFE